MARTFTDEICDRCGTLTVEGTDPAWYYDSRQQLKMKFIEHNCEEEL